MNNMRRKLLYAIGLVLLIAGYGCGSSKSEISGVVSGGEGQSLVLEKLNVNQTSVIDSVQLDPDGSFSMKIEVEEPELLILKNTEGDIINLLVSPGEQIGIETSNESFGKGYKVNGSQESEGIRILVEHLQKTRKDLDSFQAVALNIEDPASPQMDSFAMLMHRQFIKQNRFTIKYLVEQYGFFIERICPLSEIRQREPGSRQGTGFAVFQDSGRLAGGHLS